MTSKNCSKCKKYLELVMFYSEHTKKECKKCLNCRNAAKKSMKKCNKCICGEHRPCFGFITDEKPTCCNGCKKDGMVDIKNKKCLCGKHIPNFGFITDKKPTCCSLCKENGMLDIKNKKCVCGKHIPHFGFITDKKSTCCNGCKEDGMVDIKNKRCKSSFCDTLVTNRLYSGYCAHCFRNLFPDEPMARNHKTKENLVADFVIENFPDFEWKCDKKVQYGCSRKRPDLYCDFGSHVVVIETDEDKHSGYSCENLRTMTIFQDFGNRPLIMLRFNPDSFTDVNGIRVKSCFVKKNTGKLEISSKKQWNLRLNVLKEHIQKYTDSEYESDKDLRVIQLFYE